MCKEDIPDQTSKEENEDGKKTSSRVQIVISLLTLIITPFASGLVVNFQLTKGQANWRDQRRFLRLERMLDIQVEFMRGINTKILEMELSAMNIRLKQTMLGSLAGLNATTEDKTNVDQYSKELLENTLKYIETIRHLASDIQIAGLYFTENTMAVAPKLEDLLLKELRRGEDVEVIIRNFTESVKKGTDPYATLSEFVDKFDPNPNKELEAMRVQFLKGMANDMRIIIKELYVVE